MLKIVVPGGYIIPEMKVRTMVHAVQDSAFSRLTSLVFLTTLLEPGVFSWRGKNLIALLFF